jgi:hypothetical protein
MRIQVGQAFCVISKIKNIRGPNHDHSIPRATASAFAREKLKQVFVWAAIEIIEGKFLRRLQKMIAQSEAIKSLPSIPGYRWVPIGELWFTLMAQYDDISRNGRQ